LPPYLVREAFIEKFRNIILRVKVGQGQNETILQITQDFLPTNHLDTKFIEKEIAILYQIRLVQLSIPLPLFYGETKQFTIIFFMKASLVRYSMKLNKNTHHPHSKIYKEWILG